MKLSNSIVEIIKERHSVRTYENKSLTQQHRDMILDYMNNLNNPFGISVKKYIVDKKLSAEGEKLGTYGIIKGANTFVGISIPNTKLASIAAGYEFENLILYATSIGLGTVWLAATFNRERFASAMGIPKDELFPTISPLGYPAKKRSIRESLMRSSMKSSTRKEWNVLFYQEDFLTPLTEDMANEYAMPLEMLRLASSDKNTQPWRVRKSGNIYHFYVTHNPSISKGEAIIKQVDLGIGLSHFHQTVMEQGLKGSFKEISQDIELPENTYYIISWCVG